MKQSHWKMKELHEKLKGQCKYNKFGIQGIFKFDKSIDSFSSETF